MQFLELTLIRAFHFKNIETCSPEKWRKNLASKKNYNCWNEPKQSDFMKISCSMYQRCREIETQQHAMNRNPDINLKLVLRSVRVCVCQDLLGSGVRCRVGHQKSQNWHFLKKHLLKILFVNFYKITLLPSLPKYSNTPSPTQNLSPNTWTAQRDRVASACPAAAPASSSRPTVSSTCCTNSLPGCLPGPLGGVTPSSGRSHKYRFHVWRN